MLNEDGDVLDYVDLEPKINDKTNEEPFQRLKENNHKDIINYYVNVENCPEDSGDT